MLNTMASASPACHEEQLFWRIEVAAAEFEAQWAHLCTKMTDSMPQQDRKAVT